MKPAARTSATQRRTRTRLAIYLRFECTVTYPQLENCRESRRISKNLEESRRISKNLEESQRISENIAESCRILKVIRSNDAATPRAPHRNEIDGSPA